MFLFLPQKHEHLCVDRIEHRLPLIQLPYEVCNMTKAFIFHESVTVLATHFVILTDIMFLWHVGVIFLPYHIGGRLPDFTKVMYATHVSVKCMTLSL